MPNIPENLFKVVLIGAVFLVLFGAFNALFIGSQIGDTSKMSLGQIATASLGVFLQPELLIINSVLIVIGTIVMLVFARAILPV